MAMTTKFSFTEEEMEIDEGLGCPRAYARLCRNPHLFHSYNHGPPFTYLPYTLPAQEALRARDLEQLFPIIDLERNPSVNPRNYAHLLWKQLSHLGNAGFDPAKFRVDMYGNVLYFHADFSSPLAWEIDHCFPCSRGGKTVPSNLRILQWQVCRQKQNKLEFLIPWWDLQLGISVNQFLAIFASTNSDFRNRAFSWLFSEGENEELNDLQAVASHVFPQHFNEAEQEVGLAPAAIVLSCRDSNASPLKSLDINRSLRPGSPAMGVRKIPIEERDTHCKAIQQFRPNISKDVENCHIGHNKYTAIVVASESLKQREEIERKQSELRKLDSELNELKENNEAERLSIQELESMLLKRKRRVEKCRRLAESQSSYRALLQKMIRDAMHQNVVYKEQIRLNQAANNSLMARLEAQKAICDASEKELYRKFRQRDDVVDQMRPYMEHARKRSRTDDGTRTDDGLFEEKHEKNMRLLLSGMERMKRKPLQKQLRLFLEEEQKASDAGILPDEEREPQQQPEVQEERKEISTAKKADGERPEEDLSLIIPKDEKALDDELQKLALKDRKDGDTKEQEIMNLVTESLQREEDEEYRKKIGKGNVEKWLQMLLENAEKGSPSSRSPEIACRPQENTAQIDRKLSTNHPQEEIKILELEAPKESMESDLKGTEVDVDHKEASISNSKSNNKLQRGDKNPENRRESSIMLDKKNTNAEMGSAYKGVGSKSFERKDRGGEKSGKEKGLVRCESARSFRPSFPPSPSMILRKGVDCMGKKPVVMGDEDDSNLVMGKNKFIKTSIKKTYTQAIKKAMNR